MQMNAQLGSPPILLASAQAMPLPAAAAAADGDCDDHYAPMCV